MAARKKKRELSEKAQKRIRQRNLHVGITVIAAIVIIFSVIQFTLWRYVSKVDEEYICKNVFIGKTDVSGMTKEEAVKAVDNTLGDYRNKQLVLKVKDQGADVSIEEMGAEVEKKEMRGIETMTVQVPWKAIAGFRDIAAHKYQTLRMEDVYATVSDDFPSLRTMLEAILENE